MSSPDALLCSFLKSLSAVDAKIVGKFCLMFISSKLSLSTQQPVDIWFKDTSSLDKILKENEDKLLSSSNGTHMLHFTKEKIQIGIMSNKTFPPSFSFGSFDVNIHISDTYPLADIRDSYKISVEFDLDTNKLLVGTYTDKYDTQDILDMHSF